MIEFLFSGIIGSFIGLILGLIPGLHTNLLVPLVFLIKNKIFAYILLSALISMNFFEFIRTMFLNAPDEGEILALHPIQRMIILGRGKEVIELTAIGCLGGIFFSILFFPIELKIIPFIYHKISHLIPFLLLFISLHLILKEKKIKTALLIFILSGIIGKTNFDLNLKEPFLPLLTGLFGVSSLLNNIFENIEKIPFQMKKVVVEIEKKNIFNGIINGFLSASILSFIPSIGPAQASMLSNDIVKRKKNILERDKEFLISVASINTSDVIFSLAAFLSIQKARSGVIEGISKIINVKNNLFYILLTILTSSIIAYVLFKKLGYYLLNKFQKVNIKKLSYSITCFIILFVYLINSWKGLIILGLSSILGYYCIKKEVAMTNLMGSLIIPTLIFYFKIIKFL